MQYRLALTKIEKEVLYRKYRSCGLSSIEASERINEFEIYLRKLVFNLLKQNKSREHIEKKFKREFEEMCQKLEA